MKVNATPRIGRMRIVADQDGLTGRVGLGLVAQLADRIGLSEAVSAAASGRTTRRSLNRPGFS